MRVTVSRRNEMAYVAILVSFCLSLLIYLFVTRQCDEDRPPDHLGLNGVFYTSAADSAACLAKSDWSKGIPAQEFTARQVIDYFYWSNATSCGLAHDFGGKMYQNPSALDGQKAVCLDKTVAPTPGDCLVYSFGINNEWSFDDMMEQYGCEVHAFDPSMGMQDHYRSRGIRFYNLGIGDRDYVDENGWKFKSLSSIYKELLGHEGRIIDYLKMDVEGAEWAALSQIVGFRSIS